jgi:hypothetical protein
MIRVTDPYSRVLDSSMNEPQLQSRRYAERKKCLPPQGIELSFVNRSDHSLSLYRFPSKSNKYVRTTGKSGGRDRLGGAGDDERIQTYV